MVSPNSFELGLAGFGNTFSEDTNNGFNDYHEETDVLVIAGIANYLFRHSMESGGISDPGTSVGAVSSRR